MIIELDPLFASPLASFGAPASAGFAPSPRAARSRHAALAQHRAEHEAAFERAHGSLWTPGLLDRLSLPLSRIHE
jgi:hypothetical protein